MIGIFNGFTIWALWIMTIMVLFMDHTDGQGSCPRDEDRAQRLDPSRTCRKACTTDTDCSGASKSCTCDGDCGFSCFNPEAVCDEVLSISDGSIKYTYPSGATGTDKVYDTRARHSCSSGYELLGEMSRYCRSDRQWSHSHNVPNCTRVCVSPSRTADGIPTTFGPFFVGDKVTIRCVTGYQKVAGSVLERTCQADYTWSDVAYTCKLKQCGPPNDVSQGSYTVRGGKTGDEEFGFGAWVDYKCDTGYNRKGGKDSYSCTIRGSDDSVSWKTSSENWPTCVAVECPPPTAPENGQHNSAGITEFSFGYQVTYSCNMGYKLIGNEKGQCDATGGWGATPKCEGSVDEDFSSRSNSYTTTSGSFTWTEGTEISGLMGYFMQGGGTIQSVPISLTKDQRICVQADHSETEANKLKTQASNNGRTKDLLSFPASQGWTTTTFWLELVDKNADGQVRLQFVASGNVRIDNIKEVADSQCASSPVPGGKGETTKPPPAVRTTTTQGVIAPVPASVVASSVAMATVTSSVLSTSSSKATPPATAAAAQRFSAKLTSASMTLSTTDPKLIVTASLHLIPTTIITSPNSSAKLTVAELRATTMIRVGNPATVLPFSRRGRLRTISSQNGRSNNDEEAGRDGDPPDETLSLTSGPATTTDPADVTDSSNDLPEWGIALIVAAVLLVGAGTGAFVYWKFFHVTKGYAGPIGVAQEGNVEEKEAHLHVPAGTV